MYDGKCDDFDLKVTISYLGLYMNRFAELTLYGCGILTVLLLNAGLFSCTSSKGEQKQPEISDSIPKSHFGIDPSSPNPVVIGGRLMTFYEINFDNFTKDTVRLDGVKIMNAYNTTAIASFSGGSLSAIHTLKNKARVGKNIIPPGASSTVYLEIALPSTSGNLSIYHNIEYTRSLETRHFSGASISILPSERNILGPPLGEGLWAAVYDPNWERGHRRVQYIVDGKPWLPGRYAIDFIKMDEKGKYAKGDEDQIKNWYGYGADVLAVQDAYVIAVDTTFTESPTLSGHKDYSPERATGNYICLYFPGFFAFYEHLKPGSIKVKEGQTVAKGEVIASLGYTGNTTGPHLHFHLAKGKSPLGSEGKPYVFDQFTLMGKYDDFSKFGKERWTDLKKGKRIIKEEFPVSNTIINFR